MVALPRLLLLLLLLLLLQPSAAALSSLARTTRSRTPLTLASAAEPPNDAVRRPSQQRRKLAGQFIPRSEEEQENEGLDYSSSYSSGGRPLSKAALYFQDATRRLRESNNNGAEAPFENNWTPSQRSLKLRKYWDDPSWRERVLAKRRQTMERKGLWKPKAEPKDTLTASRSARRKSAAQRLRHTDEEAWMSMRLESGAALRAGMTDEGMAQKRRQRAEAAKQRYAQRRKNAKQGPEPESTQ
jgi:hypothetical protein